MIEQAQRINAFCSENGFNFVDCDVIGVKVPCALDRGYKENNNTIYISGFYVGSKRIKISYGGLKQDIILRVPIEQVPIDHVNKSFLPRKYICAKCEKYNLNLRTQDNHKSYVCPKCYKEIEDAKSQTQVPAGVVELPLHDSANASSKPKISITK